MKAPGFHHIRPLQTVIKVWNTRTQTYEFEGRILGPSKHMESSGRYSESYECEGELGYLHDSVQRHVEFRGTPVQLLTTIMEYHNMQVEGYKQFQVGNVSLTNTTDNVYVYLSAEKSTFDIIKEKLIDKLGGELHIRKENGVRFLDVVERVGEDKDTEIRLSKNVVTMTCDVDPVQIITRLTPLGTRLESADEEDTDASQARLTIETVNQGTPFVDDVSLIREFGIQGGSVVWDDVTLPTNLLSKGKTWLANQKIAHVQYQLSAVDLFLIGLDMDSFEVGHSYPVKNPMMRIDERLRVIGKSLDITSPQDASLTIGDKFKTLHQYQSDVKQSAQHMVNLQSTVSKQVGRMNSLSKNFGEATQVFAGISHFKQSVRTLSGE
ncbi:phage tail spike protein [Bacillus toyonensis]